MFIGIDGNEANIKNKVGIGEYAFRLIAEFSKIKKNNLSFEVYLKDFPLDNLPIKSENFRYKVIGPKRMWTQIALPFNLYFSSPRPDVFFTPSHYAPRFSPVPTVVSVMDLSYVHFPELFNKDDLYQLRNWTSYSVKKASRVITISEFSRNAIIKEYSLLPEKVVVIYPGVKTIKNSEFRIQNMEQLQKKFGIEGEFILFVGTLQPRKNIVRLIDAFSKLDRLGLQLVIVGKKGWQYQEILGAPKKFGVEENVRFLDFVSDEDLPSLYKHANFFILPSLYEGFGLPVLEAMSYGCPVIASNVSSLPEAGGDAALYIDPEDPSDIAKKMEKLLDDDTLRDELIKKGYEQLKNFSWEKAAAETLKVLEEAGKT